MNRAYYVRTGLFGGYGGDLVDDKNQEAIDLAEALSDEYTVLLDVQTGEYMLAVPEYREAGAAASAAGSEAEQRDHSVAVDD